MICKACRADKALVDFSIRENGRPRTECKACCSERERLRRQADPEAMKRRQRESYARHKDNAIARAKRWCAQNPEKRRQIANEYAVRNSETLRFKKHIYLDRQSSLTRAQWDRIVASSRICLYCEGPASAIDHFVPRSRSGRTEPGNLVPVCPTCNSSKKNREPLRWLEEHHGPERLARVLAFLEQQATHRYSLVVKPSDSPTVAEPA